MLQPKTERETRRDMFENEKRLEEIYAKMRGKNAQESVWHYVCVHLKGFHGLEV